MKSLAKFSLSMLFVSILTACSGGGNGGNVTSSSTSYSTSNNTSSNIVSTGSKSQTSLQSSNVAANGLINGQISMDSLIVDGKTFNLSPTGIYGQEIHFTGGININGNSNEIVKEVEDNGQYFGFTSAGVGSQRYAYFGSNIAETSVMPTSGYAQYEGDVVYSYGGVTQNADAHLNVDFAQKKVTGVFNGSYNGLVNVNADISGSSFTGTAANSVAVANLTGKFYGINASGLGGVFSDQQNKLAGAFGADVD